MRATQLTAELLIIGLINLSAFWLVFPNAVEQSGVLEEIGSLSAFGPLVLFLLLASIAYVAGFRQLSIVLGVIAGVVILKEPGGRVRLLASAVIVVGLVLIALAR